MKVLILNGSPRAGGNSEKLVREMTDVFDSLGADYEVVSVGNKDIRGCIACGYCSTHDGCVFGDIVSEVAAKLKEADGLVLVSPVYYASPNGTLISLLDRLFHSCSYDLRMKIGAAFAIARRGGTSTAFDVLNKYFTISGMPVASGDYWNNGFGREKGEIAADKEGLRNARVVAKRMVFLMNAVCDAKRKYPELLDDEDRVSTHFIR
ncbi:MAG: flavodoxin family protein [Clostridia bacterium]|nr:flavodoxin family protein [Clostridia bacterium]